MPNDSIRISNREMRCRFYGAGFEFPALMENKCGDFETPGAVLAKLMGIDLREMAMEKLLEDAVSRGFVLDLERSHHMR
jgi:hypothetical protein